MANNQQILIKAIEKAIAGGWQADKDTSWVEDYIKYMDSDEMYHLFYDASHDFAKTLWGEQTDTVEHSHIAIFDFPGYIDTTHPSHNSADIRMVQEHDMKCLECGKVLGSMWELNNTVCWFEGDYKAGWQYHLQMMVISENPIKYLGENL